MDRLKEIIRKKLAEMSATNMGGASMSAGQGDNYATPAAFSKKTNSKGAKSIYYYKLGFKPVPNIKPSLYCLICFWSISTLAFKLLTFVLIVIINIKRIMSSKNVITSIGIFLSVI